MIRKVGRYIKVTMDYYNKNAKHFISSTSTIGAQDAGIFLPAAIRSCIDGRLGTMENRMASLLYKQAVGLDMCERILADSLELERRTCAVSGRRVSTA